MDPRQNNGRGQRQRQLQPSNGQHARFSWQTPPETPPEEPATVQPQRPQHQQPIAQVGSNDRHNRAFSYAQTPIEHRAPNYYVTSNEPLPQPQSPPTPIDPRPQSIINPQSLSPQPQQPAYPSYPYEKTPLSPVSPHNNSHPATVSPVSTLHEPQRTYTQRSHARQLSALSPINTNVGQYGRPPMPATPHSNKSQASPLPQKTPITPISPTPIKKDPDYPPMTANSRKSFPVEPYSPHGFSSTTPRHAVFSPDAATGPNGLDFALHQPGQVTHPNMDMSPKGSKHEWKHSLCECGPDMGACMTGLFCPCVLYGRTSYRLSQKSAKKDPTDMLGYSATNGHCMMMGVSCGLWWLFPMIQRTRLRHLYKLTGSFGGDLVKSCCCCCCVAIQNEREVKDREESSRRWAGPASSEVYKAPPQMSYTPQR